MKKINACVFACLAVFFCATGKAQTNTFPSTGSAGIGTTVPNASSILEIKSTTQGLLIPRMTGAQRNSIASPATGLMIYQTNGTPGFYYYDGSAWTAVAPKNANKSLSNLTSPTKINADLVPDSDNLRNIGAALAWKDIFMKGKVYMGSTPFLSNGGLDNIFAGSNAGIVNSGAENTFVGALTGFNNSSGGNNTFVGSASGYYNSIAGNNTFVGFSAGYSNTTGAANTMVGSNAGLLNITGTQNCFFGNGAGLNNSAGSNNVFVGKSAGFSFTNGSSNTFIGFQAGYGIGTSTGMSNTCVGNQSGFRLTSETSFNSFFGDGSGSNTNSGQQNAFFGRNAGLNNNAGNSNTFVGAMAGQSNNSGSFNSTVGSLSDINGTISYATAIGAGAVATQSNTIILGGTGIYSANVGIGTSTPQYKLDVCGGIRSKEIRVQTGWCDYVFDQNYKLMPLHDVERYINAYHHLPEISPASEVENNGLNVGDMSAAMMKKIEELTLYVIELQKEIDELRSSKH